MRYWIAVTALIVGLIITLMVMSYADAMRKRMLSSYCKNVEQGLVDDFEDKCPKPVDIKKLTLRSSLT